MAILQGESLLNDATALLIYRLAVGAAPGALTSATPRRSSLLSAVGSVVAGYVLARLFLLAHDAASATRRARTILQFVSTFGVWMLAERLGLSPIITMVVYAMTLARQRAARARRRATASAPIRSGRRRSSC